MNNSTRSIFTDIRYASRYSQDTTSSAKPPIRRSISESATPFVPLEALERIPSLPEIPSFPASPRQTRNTEHGSFGLSGSQLGIPQIPLSPPPPPIAGKKRPTAAVAKLRAKTSQSRKRRRHEEDITLDRRSPQSVLRTQYLSSPLFFSNSPPQRPQLPPRFSSSEAGAKMLSNAQGEERTVRTVTLARGSLASATSPTTPSRPLGRSRYSSERNSFSPTSSRSPDGLDGHDVAFLLDAIGLEELLGQDPRPTFAVDLTDTRNFRLDDLHTFYANPAFYERSRQAASTVHRAARFTELGALFENLAALKAWIYGRAQIESIPSKHPPVLIDGDVMWSCTFLRRRICVVSGTPQSNVIPSKQIQVEPSQRSPTLKITTTPSQHDTTGGVYAEGKRSEEPLSPDYFGSVATKVAPLPAHAHPDNPVSSIEHVDPDNLSLPSSPPDSRSCSPNLDPDILTSNVAGCSPHATAANGNSFDNDSSHKEVGFFDWTRLPISDDLPAHIRFARSVDWSQTALGPIESWSADLRQMCNLIMASPHPAAMYWGEELVAIYNEAYVLLAGQKHPTLMGQSYRHAWAEIWDEVKDVFASAQTTGQATMKDDDCLFIRRNNFLEETYFSWSIIPMVGEDGSVMGLYNPAFEKTRRKIAERRMLTLREIGERTATARDVKSFWEEVLSALECNEFDTPFVLLYSLYGESDYLDDASMHSSNATGLSSQKMCALEGSLGVPTNHPAAPLLADLNGDEGYVNIFREVQRTNKPIYLDVAHSELSPSLLEGLEVRGFSDPVQAVVVCPIHPTTGESTLGFLVLGVNPRRPYDEDYHLFVQLLERQLATSLASVVLFEEEIKRGQQAAKLAALDRMELSEQLAARTQEAIDSETKFSRMAEFVPVGVFIGSSEGVITYCNESWLSMTHVPPNNIDKWMDYVKPEDKAGVRRVWHDLTVDKKSVSAEFRFQSLWTDRNNAKGDMWVLFSAYPERNENGSLKGVFGSITNISSQKWAEGLQTRKMEEAVEHKRQQENFIDITSHEMRNPLSAILQCADEIASSLGERKKGADKHADKLLFENAIDAAHTIILCAQHQKRIVDDILTLSKLDSALLMVTPVDVQPVVVAQRALKMFEGEVQSADISMQFKVDASIQEVDVDWCKFDPSRVLQVLINLTTNVSLMCDLFISSNAQLTLPGDQIHDFGEQTGYFNIARSVQSQILRTSEPCSQVFPSPSQEI